MTRFNGGICDGPCSCGKADTSTTCAKTDNLTLPPGTYCRREAFGCAHCNAKGCKHCTWTCMSPNHKAWYEHNIYPTWPRRARISFRLYQLRKTLTQPLHNQHTHTRR